MTGARWSGKTILIGVMMEQFSTFLRLQHMAFLEPLGTTESRWKENYLKPLYEHLRLPGATRPAKDLPLDPLLWSFRFGGAQYCLSLIDAAGEDLESPAIADPKFAYLGKADLIVNLVDPLKVPGVAAVLEGMVTIPAGAGRDLDVLRNVLKARAAHRQPNDPPQYLAITLSKFDILQDMRSRPHPPWQAVMNRPGAAIQREPSFVDPFENKDDGDLLHAELLGLLDLLNADLLLTAAQEGGIRYRLFATSALGVSPNSDTIQRRGITPYRVLDILKAALALKGAGA